MLTCQTHPTGPGLEVELGMYDTVYESQYGQYEKKVSDAKLRIGGEGLHF